jgi:hypothetical protein
VEVALHEGEVLLHPGEDEVGVGDGDLGVLRAGGFAGGDGPGRDGGLDRLEDVEGADQAAAHV